MKPLTLNDWSQPEIIFMRRFDTSQVQDPAKIAGLNQAHVQGSNKTVAAVASETAKSSDSSL